MFANARTIDDVIDRLSDVVAWCRRENSRLGYFPALYRKVTVQVKADIAAGRFDDGARMEVLDVRFANRYFEALDAYRAGTPPTRSWAYSFDRAASDEPLILQHLLLGINAHINLDLGIAAVETAPADALPALQADFERINAILETLVDDVQDRISTLWPVMEVLDTMGGRLDESLCSYCLSQARLLAWARAECLASTPPDDVPNCIAAFDTDVCALSRRLCPPDGPLPVLLRPVRAVESDCPRTIIDALAAA